MKIGMIGDNLGAPSFGKLLGTAAGGFTGCLFALRRHSSDVSPSAEIEEH